PATRGGARRLPAWHRAAATWVAWDRPARRRPRRAGGRASTAASADVLAQAAVERAERVGHGVDRAGAGLEDRRRVDRDPLKAHGLQLDGPRGHPVVLGVEALALGVARRRRHHALQADALRIA